MNREDANWERYLKVRGSTPEWTRAAWTSLGEEGNPPGVGFWMPQEGLPVFTAEGLKQARAETITSRFGLKRTPDLPPVAEYRSPYGVKPVFRIRDLEALRSAQAGGASRRKAAPSPQSEAGSPAGQGGAGGIAGESLRSRLAEIGPVRPRQPRQVVLHVGPTNSGKTHAALARLAQARRGTYLAPLRLLAWEAQERLVEQGCPADLLTGEEYRPVEGARVVAATVEMFPPGVYDVVVVDEAQLIEDPDRGWAWARAFLQAEAEELHVCCAPQAEAFLRQLFTALGDRVEVRSYRRLLPLSPHAGATPLDRLPQRSAVVAFSRQTVLRLKAEIERLHQTPCAVVYGALPPDVRREQARRVRTGESPFVAATDAIGMGLNFPVEHVFLFATSKFDGIKNRVLRPAEVQQIVGRAGRYGLSQGGWFGAVTKGDHRQLVQLATSAAAPIRFGYLQPSLAELEVLPGRMAERLTLWRRYADPGLGPLLRLAPLQEMQNLASMIPAVLERRDPSAVYRLITAPVSDASLPYWRKAVQALSRGGSLPAPYFFSPAIRSDSHLDAAETSLREHELCLWLLRRGFSAGGTDAERILAQRNWVASAIDQALADGRRFGGCRECGRPLSPHHRYGICDKCHRRRYRHWEGDWEEW